MRTRHPVALLPVTSSSEVAVTCRSIRRGVWAAVAIAATGFLHVPRATAQSPGTLPPATVPAPALALYRAPVIALAQPAAGGSIPQDKPVVVFRFAQGEASDAIDARSLVVTVDNVDVSLAFQIAGGDAWGSLARHLDSAHGDLLSVGPHEVTARICSERGACGSVSAVVIAASVQRTGEGSTPATNSRRGKLLDMLVKATRKLLLP